MRAAFNRLTAPWLMVTATVLFALMGVCVKMASQTASTGEVVFFRGGVGAVLMGLLAWRTGLKLRTAVPMLHLQRGASGVSALAMWFYTLGTLPLSTAVTLNYMSSVWMAVFLVLQVAWRRWRGQAAPAVPVPLLVAVAIGFLGVTLVLRPTIERDLWLPGLIGLVSGTLSATAYFQVASLGRAGEPEVRVVFYFSLFGAVSGLLISAVETVYQGHGWTPPTGATLMWLLGTGLFATLAQVCMTRAYARGNALAMASLQYLGIAHAFVLGVVLFDDPVHGIAVLGMALIVLAGIGATQASAPLKARR
ncbi:DMT family transporter [uncultured Aquabacterium sp.]|uniref:DMT family transporter n=1 Tax=uncultured Aquabacterium sp. TaxID=158753 RepID=UPI00260969AB|nr:DMT family transporter [uncultured Aquabacterium sp.]